MKKNVILTNLMNETMQWDVYSFVVNGYGMLCTKF